MMDSKYRNESHVVLAQRENVEGNKVYGQRREWAEAPMHQEVATGGRDHG